MFNVKDIIRDSSGGLVKEVLFPEQRCELVEGSNMSVREADKSFQHRSFQCTPKQLTLHSVRPPL